jgi:MYXO-CTERM domain-containing protein
MEVVRAGTFALACVVACGSQDPPSERTGMAVGRIQGGTADTTDGFAVAVVAQSGDALCSGMLLGPNLVATARHCVSTLSTQAVDCASTTFGPTVAANTLAVATDPVLTNGSALYAVDTILVPSAANQTSVCGNDLALLILGQSIPLAQYVTPAISPPMTDHSAYSTTITAIGYGIDMPSDTNGTTAGTRRIRKDIDLLCISDDTTFVDCLSDPTAAQFIGSGEFETQGDTCDGDSGSGAFEQRNFNAGRWVSFGVLSRGGVDADGGSCVGSIYTRFDGWTSLLVEAAQEAAQRGGYSVPAWAVGTTGAAATDAQATSTAVADAATVACLPTSAPCNGNGDCCSNNCLSRDNGTTFLCSTCNSDAPCDVGFVCEQGSCVLPPSSGAPSRSSSNGCAIAGSAPGPSGTHAWRLAALAAVGILGVGRRRTKRKRVTITQSSGA